MANNKHYRDFGPVPLGGWGTQEQDYYNPFEDDTFNPFEDKGFRGPTRRKTNFNPYQKEMSPVWANLLFKGVRKRDKLKKSVRALKDDPSMIFKGVLGKSLLDKHINPFFDKLLPDSTKLDVLKRQIKFQPHDRFNMTLGKKGRGAKLDLNWRF